MIIYVNLSDAYYYYNYVLFYIIIYLCIHT
jgi:hypothetical protein